MYTPVNPSFTIQKCGVTGCNLHGRGVLMKALNSIYILK